jgi:phage major head subunit gpT-like protein
MAIVTNALLANLRTGFVAAYQRGLSRAQPMWSQVATRIPSSNAQNTYGWLGQFPKLREWVGDRVFRNMKEEGYAIVNKLFEGTVGVTRTAIEDDQLGIYTPLFEEMGYGAATHPDELVFGLLKNGHTTNCFDGQSFFDTDHPVYAEVDGTGAVSLVSNNLVPAADAGPAWFLLDVSRPLKPLIFQERTKPELQVITNADNEHVFIKDEIPYGVRYRCNAGFGFWQMAVRSQHALNADSFEQALQALQTMKADGGRPLGLGTGGKNTLLLVVPSTLNGAARKVIGVSELPGGGTNPWYDAATIHSVPWLL